MSREQAAIVFDLAVKMINFDPMLKGLVRVVPSKRMLVGLPMNVQYKAVAAEGKTAHGFSPVVAILDEIGQVRGPHNPFIEAITTAQGAHEKPLLLAISTQAQNDGDMFSLWLEDALRGLDKSIVCHLHTADANCELGDKKAWAKANPALGKFRSLDDVKAQSEIAMRMPTAEPGFRNLILNQRVETESPFVSKNIWDANAGAADAGWGDWPVFAGLDLSATRDLTAFVLVAVEPGPVYHVRSYFWLPEDGLVDKARADRVPYDTWHKQGLLLSTPGKAIQYEYVAGDLKTLLTGLNWQSVEFDRWGMKYLKPSLERADFRRDELEKFNEFGQGFASMGPAVKALEIALLNGQIRHGGNEILKMCASNARTDTDAAGNRKFVKGRETGRIDGMVALAMAMGSATKFTEMSGDFMKAWA
jgi:phage terminase large subunit-like protein